jgi:hypothetical protein
MVAIEGERAREMQRILRWAELYEGPVGGECDAASRKPLSALIGNENFEERFDEEKGSISKEVFELLRRKFTSEGGQHLPPGGERHRPRGLLADVARSGRRIPLPSRSAAAASLVLRGPGIYH